MFCLAAKLAAQALGPVPSLRRRDLFLAPCGEAEPPTVCHAARAGRAVTRRGPTQAVAGRLDALEGVRLPALDARLDAAATAPVSQARRASWAPGACWVGAGVWHSDGCSHARLPWWAHQPDAAWPLGAVVLSMPVT